MRWDLWRLGLRVCLSSLSLSVLGLTDADGLCFYTREINLRSSCSGRWMNSLSSEAHLGWPNLENPCYGFNPTVAHFFFKTEHNFWPTIE